MSTKSVQTIADIARIANVSKSTVSRALNDSPLIKDETKELIRAIAREHNFHINAPARQLSRKQSATIGFVTCAYHKEFSVADLFGLELSGGISRGLSAKGYDMLVVYVETQDTEWMHQYLDAGRVDGFILYSSSRKQFHVRTLLKLGAPFIVWGVPQPNTHYPSVTGDNFNGGRLATQRLLDGSRRRIAFLGGPPDELEVQARYAGYETALSDAGLAVDPALVAHGDYSNTSGAVAMRQLFQQAPDLDAVFVNSDLMAVAAMNVIREQGRSIPEQVAVVGYDDLSIAEFSNPPLTTIRQNVPLAGKLLAQNLIEYLQTGVVTNVTLPVDLVVRQSA
ncbi:MAG TPA: LacI family DNA-binding transcriptional regulator [Anaerolineaceae bacterium]|nr:LacI family DNA-binding transcriptional regulator [Anaerolineaceae bacterium]